MGCLGNHFRANLPDQIQRSGTPDAVVTVPVVESVNVAKGAIAVASKVSPLSENNPDDTIQRANAFPFTKNEINRRIAEIDIAGLKDVVLRDTETRGLILRKQRRDWMLAIERKIRSKVYRITLEPYTTRTDLNAARAMAESIMTDIRRGEYVPAATRAAKKQMETDSANMPLGEAFRLHFAINPQIRESTRESYAYGLLAFAGKAAPRNKNGHADPVAGAEAIKLPITALTPQKIRDAYDRLTPASGASMLRSVRAIWNTWAAETEIETANPVSKVTRKRGRVAKVKPRSGALAPSERAPWYTAAEQIAMTSATFNTARALQFLFLTGLRRGEVLAMPFSEVDLEAGMITIAGARMKAGEDLQRPITREMRRILDAQRKMNPDSQWVFPASRGGGHLRDTRKTLKRLPTLITNHDLRRTFIVAGELARVPQIAVKMLVGHSTSDITEAYARAIVSELPELAQEIEDHLLEGVNQ